ncbi:MAG: hypothetical protein WCA46_26275, partial [Actinocatenispora sp.]
AHAGAAARRAATAMLLAILLAPATRFGYLLYPLAYALWALPLSDARPDRPTSPAVVPPEDITVDVLSPSSR